MNYVLIVGAKSDIAKALAYEYAKHGYNLYLAARGSQGLEFLAKDINTRFQCRAELVELDVINFESHQKIYDDLSPKPLGVIMVAGYLGSQDKAEKEFSESRQILDTNYTGVMNLLSIVAKDFECRKSGFIVGISSVAGDRGRKSNYYYGAAKAAFTTFLSGLRNRLSEAKVQVLTVKPGFVDTKMTAGMALPKPLLAQPKLVAQQIFKAQQQGREVLYTKKIWRYIMWIIRAVPERLFKKMSI